MLRSDLNHGPANLFERFWFEMNDNASTVRFRVFVAICSIASAPSFVQFDVPRFLILLGCFTFMSFFRVLYESNPLGVSGLSCREVIEQLDQMVFIYFYNKKTGKRGMRQVSSNCMEFYGKKANEVIDSNFRPHDFIHPLDLPHADREARISFSTGADYLCEKRIVKGQRTLQLDGLELVLFCSLKMITKGFF